MAGRLLKAEEVAELIGSSTWTVYALARKGQLRHREITPSMIRFAQEDLDEFVDSAVRVGR